LVHDAGLRLLHAFEILGIRGVLLHAISSERERSRGDRLPAFAVRSHDADGRVA